MLQLFLCHPVSNKRSGISIPDVISILSNAGSRPAITLDGSESTAQLEALKNLDALFLIIDVPETDSASRVHASRRWAALLRGF